MKSSITNRQMFFLLFVTLTTYTIISIPKVIAQGPGTGGWVSLIVTSLFFAVFVAAIVRLNSAFPGMMLFEYSARIVGKVSTYLIVSYFLLYFSLVSAFLSIQLTAVLRAEFYPETPRWAMLTVSMIVFGVVAYRGITSVGRFFEVIGTKIAGLFFRDQGYRACVSRYCASDRLSVQWETRRALHFGCDTDRTIRGSILRFCRGELQHDSGDEISAEL